MGNKRYIREIGVIHSVLWLLSSIFAVSGIMYAATTMVGLTIVSQEEYDVTSGVNLSGDIFSGYDLTGNIETITTTGGTWTGTGNTGDIISGANIDIIPPNTGSTRTWTTNTGSTETGSISTGNNLTGDTSTGNNLTGGILTGNTSSGNNITGNSVTSNTNHYSPSKVITPETISPKRFIIADENTEKYNPPRFEDILGLFGQSVGNIAQKIGKYLGFRTDDIVMTSDTTDTKYHGAADEYMCRVDSINLGHGAADLTLLQKAHNLLDRQNPTILHAKRTESIYSRRFLFSEIIVL